MSYKEKKYFIVEKDDLGAYGSKEGITKAEAIAELETLGNADLEKIVVIVGHIVRVKTVTKVSLEDN